MNCRKIFILLNIAWFGISCQKDGNPEPPIEKPSSFAFADLKVDDLFDGFEYEDVSAKPEIKISFSAPLDKQSAPENVSFRTQSGDAVQWISSFEDNDSTIVILPQEDLKALTKYVVSVSTNLKSKAGGKLQSELTIKLTTALDSTDKFPRISDEELLTLVQKQTFKYFWDFGHPISGLARERNTSGNTVTSGGSGFGIMTIPVGVERKFISRQEGLERTQKIVTFLTEKADKFHGAFPHWLDGVTGKVVPFSQKDNGADLVETSYLMAGLLTVRQYFNGADAQETKLRNDINQLWQNVEWDWFRKNNENVLYWHWSPDYAWDMNLPIHGWNECLITYILAASSPTHSIDILTYTNGWAGKDSFRNGKSYYGYQLPLGENYGGPLFFSQYSFLGLNPTGLSDAYANYFTQNKNHTLINYTYCKTNPLKYKGYSDSFWGLTASDIPGGYSASSPTNDLGVITPTAALSAFPYTPQESMKALHFFYYKLGDKLWGEYGFYDACSLDKLWFADSYLAIDQGPIILMIENYRTGLIWNLMMSAPELKIGLKKLDFSAPGL